MTIKKRILLVEDDLSILQVTKLRLEHEGYEVVTATDGEEAVRLTTVNGGVDLILMDVKMPKLNGVEATRRLKANPATAKIPIIIFTASSVRWQRMVDECIEIGVSDWMMKPFQTKELLEKINQALQERGKNND